MSKPQRRFTKSPFKLGVDGKLHPVVYVDVAFTLRWRQNGHDGVSNHQPHDCLLNRLFRRRSKKTSKLSLTGLCAGNSPGTGEFPAQMASNAENVSIWWRHHVIIHILVLLIAVNWFLSVNWDPGTLTMFLACTHSELHSEYSIRKYYLMFVYFPTDTLYSHEMHTERNHCK